MPEQAASMLPGGCENAPRTAARSRVDAILEELLPPLEELLARELPEPVAEGVIEFLVFGVKQAWACLFGGLLLAGVLLTGLFWPADAPLARYDALFLYAVAIQALFLAVRLERPREAVVILVFHIVGTIMELFKTEMGSWTYPEPNVLRLNGVPLFSGFMYASVGSYLARVARTLDFSFDNYPSRAATVALAALIYANFFTHHFGPDIRLGLFAATGLLYGRTWVCFTVWRRRRRMPLLAGFFLVSLFIWIAENLSTLTGVWLYPDQLAGWRPVSFGKLGSWFLLMIISWVLLTLVREPARAGSPVA